MAIETIGRYQLHLIARESPEPGKWDAFVTVLKFDDEEQDFRCIAEKQRVAASPFASYGDAIDAARDAGNELIKNREERKAFIPADQHGE